MPSKDYAEIRSYQVLDSLDAPETGAVEVEIELTNGQKRWCFFFTPDRIARVGDYVDGTQVRMHLGVRNMIVVSELTSDIIDRVLNILQLNRLLLDHTCPVDLRIDF